MSALTETAFTPEGVWGGTLRPERTAAWTAKMRRLQPDPDFKLEAGKNSDGITYVSGGVAGERVTDADRHRIAQEIADEFEASLPERLATLQARADAHMAMLEARRAAKAAAVSTPTAPRPACCRRCGVRLHWRQRSDARYCGGACKKAAYRERSAA